MTSSRCVGAVIRYIGTVAIQCRKHRAIKSFCAQDGSFICQKKSTVAFGTLRVFRVDCH